MVGDAQTMLSVCETIQNTGNVCTVTMMGWLLYEVFPKACEGNSFFCIFSYVLMWFSFVTLVAGACTIVVFAVTAICCSPMFTYKEMR